MVTFESLGIVSYSPSIGTMAVSLTVSHIFSIKEWPDLKIYRFGVVQGHLKWRGSIYHVRYDFLLVGVVTIALSCTIFEFMDVE